MKPLIIAAAGSLILAACATVPTVYAPAGGPSTPGYSEFRIETGRYRVTFRGGAGAPMEQVSDYALLRAADLAIAEGYDWFRVADRYTRQTGEGSGPRVSIGGGGGPGPFRSGVGVGVGTSFNLGGGPALTQTIEVLMGKGVKPGDRDVYDAREVRRAIGQRA